MLAGKKFLAPYRWELMFSRLKAGTGRVPTPSYIRSMRVAIFLATLLAGSISAIASATSITSPDHPRTFAYGEITWRQLYLEPARGGLMARITFSNLPYASDDDPRGRTVRFSFSRYQIRSSFANILCQWPPWCVDPGGAASGRSGLRPDRSGAGRENVSAKRERSRHRDFDRNRLPARRKPVDRDGQ
jgi:hypothetical protein